MKKIKTIALWAIVSVSLLSLATVVIAGPQRVKRVLVSIYYKCSPVVVNPDWKDKTPEYALKLKDRDIARKPSIKIGVGPFAGKNDIPEDAVKKVKDCRSYVVRSNYSQHYLTPEAKSLLDEIGDRFTAKCAEMGFKAKFQVTSLLRTEDDLKNLSKTGNKNVSSKSLHRYGTTFDISYKHFICLKSAYAKDCDRILAEVLTDMRNEKRCWVLREMREPCYHITVRP